MTLSRRDFMKFVGISISSLWLTKCASPALTPPPATITCYTVTAPPPITPSVSKDPRARLRLYWLSFGELAIKTREESDKGLTDNLYGQGLVRDHRTALDELVAGGTLTVAVADLIQEAYGAAVNHVWRSNALITCYEPAMIDFAPTSAQILVDQSAVLDQLSRQGTVEPQTLENARLALEHDLAFYTLSDAEVEALYRRLVDEWQGQGQGRPEFNEVELTITPEDQAAAQFIIDLLTGK